MTIAEYLEDVETDTADLMVLTAQVLDQLMSLTKKEMRVELFPLVYDAVRRGRRNRTRIIERIVTGHDDDIDVAPAFTDDDGAPSGKECDPNAGRKAFLVSGFLSPARQEHVLWGEATIVDHISRADFLRKMASGLGRTASTHERAAELIQSAGVDCLNDLGDDFDPMELGS